VVNSSGSDSVINVSQINFILFVIISNSNIANR